MQELLIDRGDHQLVGHHFAAAEPSGTVALLLPGFPDGGQDVLDLGRNLSAAGIDVVTIRYSGTHGSGGRYSIAESMRDIAAAVEYLRDPATQTELDIVASRLILGGYSFGGGMALAYAAHDPDIQAVVSVAGTDHGQFARRCRTDREYADMLGEVFDSYMAPDGPVVFEGREAIAELLADTAPYDLRLQAPRLADRSILLIGGWSDRWVSLAEHLLPLTESLVSAGAELVDMEMVLDDHAFAQSRQVIAERIRAWIDADAPRVDVANAHWTREACLADVVLVEAAAEQLRPLVPRRFPLRVDGQGNGVIALVARRCTKYAFDETAFADVEDLQAWIGLDMDAPSRPVEGCEEVWPTLSWFWLNAGSTNPDVAAVLRACGLDYRRIEGVDLSREAGVLRGSLVGESGPEMVWEAAPDTAAARTVGLNHVLYTMEDGETVVHVVRAKGRLRGFRQPGSLSLARDAGLTGCLVGGAKYPVVIHTFESLDAAVTWYAR